MLPRGTYRIELIHVIRTLNLFHMPVETYFTCESNPDDKLVIQEYEDASGAPSVRIQIDMHDQEDVAEVNLSREDLKVFINKLIEAL
jgi:hypothetical protein